jgi:hypothetical protein
MSAPIQYTPKKQKRYPMQREAGYPLPTACCERCGQRVFVKGDEARVFCDHCINLILTHDFLAKDWVELEPLDKQDSTEKEDHPQ